MDVEQHFNCAELKCNRSLVQRSYRSRYEFIIQVPPCVCYKYSYRSAFVQHLSSSWAAIDNKTAFQNQSLHLIFKSVERQTFIISEVMSM